MTGMAPLVVLFNDLHVPKSLNFIDAFRCQKQKCMLISLNLAHPVHIGLTAIFQPRFPAFVLYRRSLHCVPVGTIGVREVA